MSVKIETLENNMNQVFIETGTYKGETTSKAVDIGFNKVYTIELQDRLFEESKNNLKDKIEKGKIEIIKGDSSEVLPEILKKVDVSSTILLDAHIDGGNFINGITPNIKWCPLYNELKAIKEHHINTHTILVDDVRILGNIGWGKEVVLDEIINIIKDINPNYIISYDDGEVKNDVLVAKL